MKKIFQLILAGMMILPVSLNAQKDAKSFVKQYKKQEGFTVVTIGKPAMKMIGFFAKFSGDDEAKQILSRVNGVQVLTFDSNEAKGLDFNGEALAFCQNNGYEEYIEVVEAGETVKIFGKTEGEAITGLIILNCSNRNADVDMVCLKGKFTAGDMQSIYNNKGNHIAGI